MSWKLDYSPKYFTSNSYNASGIYAMIILQTSILFRINEQQVKALSKKRISMHFHFIRNKRQLNQNFRIFEFLNVWIFKLLKFWIMKFLNYETGPRLLSTALVITPLHRHQHQEIQPKESFSTVGVPFLYESFVWQTLSYIEFFWNLILKYLDFDYKNY